MPRVTQEHRDARRMQILDAARRCFIRNGFHATSMQDVFAESGLSAGAVYRYFRGKQQIIEAIADLNVGRMVRMFDASADHPELQPFPDLIEGAFDRVLELERENGVARLVAQVWAEATRSPEIAALFGARLAALLDRVAAVVSIYKDRGMLDAEASPTEVAHALVALLQGSMIQITGLGEAYAASCRAGIRALADGITPVEPAAPTPPSAR